jgi:Flp pilus assembly pilin Flp
MFHVTDFRRDERAAVAMKYGFIVTGIALNTLAAISGISAKLAAVILLLMDGI